MWSAKHQEIISLLTTESEYVAATYAAKEALWLHSIISQLFSVSLNRTTLFSDNQSAIALTKEHQYHGCTKHIDIQFHFIRWVIEDGELQLIYCPTYKGTSIDQSQTFCKRTWSCSVLRRSVGARRSMVLGAQNRNATCTRREHMVPELHITPIALISSFMAHILS